MSEFKAKTASLPLLAFAVILTFSSVSFGEKEQKAAEDIAVARGLFKDGLYRLAVKELEAALQKGVKGDELCDVNLLLGKSHFFLKRYDSVTGPLESFIKNGCSYEGQEEAYYYIGSAYIEIGEMGNAKEQLEKFRLLYPESSHMPQVINKLGKITYQEGLARFNEREYEKALGHFSKVRGSIPAEKLLAGMADSLLYLGRYIDAGRRYGELLEIVPEGPERGRINYQLAYIDYKLGKYDEAIAGMETFVAKYPGHSLLPSAKNVVLWSLYRQKRYEESLNYLEKIDKKEADPVDGDAGKLMGTASRLVFLGESVDAMELLEEGLKRFGEDPFKGEMLLLLAKAYSGVGYEYMEFETYGEIINRYPSSNVAKKSLVTLGEVNFRKGLYSGAAGYFESFLQDDSLGAMSDDARYHLAESLFRMGKVGESRENFKILIDNFGDSPYLFQSSVRMADIDTLSGEFMEAAKQYISILKSTKGGEIEEELLWKGAEASKKGGDAKSASSLYKTYLKKYPKGSEADKAVTMLAEISYMAGDYEKGADLLKGIVTSDRKGGLSPGHALKLARGYIRLNNMPDAVETLKLIIKESPKSEEAAVAYYLQGWIAQGKKDLEAANSQYMKLLKEFPASPLREDAMWQLGNNHFLMGSYKKALKAFSDFSESFPYSYRDSEAMARNCYSAMGEYKNALEKSAAFFEFNPDSAVDIRKRFEEARALFEVESHDDALKVAEGIINKFPSHPLSVKMMVMAGEIYLAKGEREQSSKYYLMARRALKEGHLRNLVLFRLGETAFYEKDYRGSLVELEGIAYTLPDSAQEIKEAGDFMDIALMKAKSYFMKGEAYLQLNLGDKAVESYRHFVDDYGEVEGLYKERLKAGLAFQQHKEYEQSVKTMSALIAGSAERKIKAEAQYWTGECYQYMGEAERAIVEYLKVAYLYPSEGMWALTARYMAAELYKELGGYEEAITLYEKVARESGDKRKSEYARKKIEELKKLLPEDAGDRQ